MELFRDLVSIQIKSRIRSLDRRRQELTAIPQAILLLFLILGIVAGGYVLPFGLHATMDISPARIVNTYFGLYLPVSFLSKAIFVSLPVPVVLPYRTLPLPPTYLANLIIIRSIFNSLFLLECAFLFSFSLACVRHFEGNTAWTVALALTLAVISLYALLCKMAVIQWAHRYPFQRRINFTASLTALILAVGCSKQDLPGSLYGGFLNNAASGLLIFLPIFFLLLWWFRRLILSALRYA